MSLTRAIAKNSTLQIGGKLIGAVLGILTVAVMTRHLGQRGYGEFTTALSFLQFFGILVDFGLTLSMMRFMAKPDVDESRVASNIMSLRLLSGAVFFGLAAAVGWLMPYPTTVRAAISVGALSFLCISATGTLTGVFQKKLAVAQAAAAEVVSRGLLLVGILIAARLDWGVVPMVAMLTVANLFQLTAVLLAARRLVKLRPAFDWLLWKEIIRESWPLGLSVALNLVYLKGDVIIMSLTRTQSEVGLYGAAYKVLDVVTIIPTVFMGLVMPVLAAAWFAGQREDFARRLGRTFDALLIFALPIALGAWPVGRDLMSFVAGSQFADAGPLLAILMLAGLAVFMSALFGHTIVAMGLQRPMLWGYGIDAALSIGLYLLLIPRFGAPGAAWVTVFSEVFIAIATAVVVLRVSGARPSLRVFWRAAVCSLLMAWLVQSLGDYHVLVRIAAGAAFYGVTLYACGGIDRETIARLLTSRPDAKPPVIASPPLA